MSRLKTAENRELKKVEYYLHQKRHETVLLFDDDSVIYIYIEFGSIFVTDCNYEELTKLIESDEYDIDSFEMYDTIDGCNYYRRSSYADYIDNALLNLSHRMFVAR